MLSIAADGNDLVRVAEAFSDSGEFFGADGGSVEGAHAESARRIRGSLAQSQCLAGMKDIRRHSKPMTSFVKVFLHPSARYLNAGAMAALAGIPQLRRFSEGG